MNYQPAESIFTQVAAKSTSTRKEWPFHLLFWLGYTIFWHSIFSPEIFGFLNFITSSIFTVFHAIAAYFNLQVLMPRLLNRKRYFQYVVSLILTLFVAAAMLAFGLYQWFEWMMEGLGSRFLEDRSYLVASMLGSTFSAIGLTMAIQMVRQRRRLERHQRQLEKEKLNAELQFLRGQLDPHFLFNALNSIYFLIPKDPDRASEALAGFSDLLRYQLYKANADQIPLAQELDYLQKYAHLAQLRHSSSLEVDLDFPDDLGGLQIPPLLILPLLENAFKYVKRDGGRIKASVRLEEQTLSFQITNNKEQGGHPASEVFSGGIGLTNLGRRLNLLYPGKHQLEVTDEFEQYTVYLSLEHA